MLIITEIECLGILLVVCYLCLCYIIMKLGYIEQKIDKLPQITEKETK